MDFKVHEHQAPNQQTKRPTRTIASRDLQLLGHVRYAPVIEWQQPAPEIIARPRSEPRH
ncbi:MAG TPA: hypothetical protein VIR00_18660 [Micromonosporaceae bacterium]|jgi:hypothetical protein